LREVAGTNTAHHFRGLSQAHREEGQGFFPASETNVTDEEDLDRKTVHEKHASVVGTLEKNRMGLYAKHRPDPPRPEPQPRKTGPMALIKSI